MSDDADHPRLLLADAVALLRAVARDPWAARLQVVAWLAQLDTGTRRARSRYEREGA